MQVNSIRKANKYNRLINDLSSTYNKVTFINLSMGALGVMGSSCDSFLLLLQDLSIDKLVQKRTIMRTISIAIRASYFIFCRRNKPWKNPELRTFNSFSYYFTFELCCMSIIIIFLVTFHV